TAHPAIWPEETKRLSVLRTSSIFFILSFSRLLHYDSKQPEIQQQKQGAVYCVFAPFRVYSVLKRYDNGTENFCKKT
ncbi:MAG: hypothetical protein IJQ88_02085, partial [Clostridia bacterium]|nr:hypothetical protein [Clostridia bacterium]